MEALLTSKELAEALGMGEQLPRAMRRAGYVFEIEALRKTTLSHALAALRRGGAQFVAAHYLREGWEQLPKVLAPETPATTPQ